MGAWRARAALAAGIVLSWCVDVRAQDAGAAAAPPPPAEAPTTGQKVTVTVKGPETADWPERYGIAKQALLDGEWEKAASALEALAAAAPSAEDARAAKELADLARYWQKRDVAFIQRQALGESTWSSKAVGRRTTDELVTLYTMGAFYGAGLGLSIAGLAIPPNSSPDAAAFIVPAIVGAGLGIGGVALTDMFGRIRYGQAEATVTGTFLGLGEAILFDSWHAVMTSGNPTAAWDPKAYVGIGIATTTLGGALGAVLGGFLPMTPGRASWVTSAGLWGGGMVAGIASAAAGAGGAKTYDGVLLATLVGYNAGIAGGILSAAPFSPSIARVRLIDLGAIVGGLTMFGIYAAVATSTRPSKDIDGYAAMGLTSLGIAAGMTTSFLLTMGMAPDHPSEADATKKEKAPSAIDFHPMLSPMQGGASAGIAGTF